MAKVVYSLTAEMNVERVQLRVVQGGHAVVEERIRARRERSFRQLPWFLDQADRALIFDPGSCAMSRLAVPLTACGRHF
jgi:predicted ABC-type ATPase